MDDLDHLLVVNDLPKVLHYIKKIKNLSTNRRMDIILDNAGMELVFDMIFAEYTLAMGLVDKVVIHMKVLRSIETVAQFCRKSHGSSLMLL